MKRIIALISIVVLAFAMVGCGDKEDAKEKKTALGDQTLVDIHYTLDNEAWKDQTNYRDYEFKNDEKEFDLDVSRTTLSEYYGKKEYLKTSFDYIKSSDSYKNFKQKKTKVGKDEAIEYSFVVSDYLYYNGYIIFHKNVAYKFQFRAHLAKVAKDEAEKIKDTITFDK